MALEVRALHAHTEEVEELQLLAGTKVRGVGGEEAVWTATCRLRRHDAQIDLAAHASGLRGDALVAGFGRQFDAGRTLAELKGLLPSGGAAEGVAGDQLDAAAGGACDYQHRPVDPLHEHAVGAAFETQLGGGIGGMGGAGHSSNAQEGSQGTHAGSGR